MCVCTCIWMSVHVGCVRQLLTMCSLGLEDRGGCQPGGPVLPLKPVIVSLDKSPQKPLIICSVWQERRDELNIPAFSPALCRMIRSVRARNMQVTTRIMTELRYVILEESKRPQTSFPWNLPIK